MNYNLKIIHKISFRNFSSFQNNFAKLDLKKFPHKNFPNPIDYVTPAYFLASKTIRTSGRSIIIGVLM